MVKEKLEKGIKLNSALKIKKDEKFFCILPFVHISFQPNNKISLCCSSAKICDYSSKSLLQIWTGKKFEKIRKKILLGEVPIECRRCFESEKITGKSTRIESIENGVYDRYLPSFLIERESLIGSNIKTLDIGSSAYCNLKCRMCHFVINGDSSKNEIENNNKVKTYIKETLNSLEFVRLTGGEPFYNPDHENFLKAMLPNAKNITLQYNTNLSFNLLERKNILVLWEKFKKIKIAFSLDGMAGANDYIRFGGNYSMVLKNIDILKKHKKVLNLTCSSTFQALNAFDTPELLKTMVTKDIFFFSKIVVNPDFLSTKILPEKTKKKLIEKILSLANEIRDNKIKIKENKKYYIKLTESFVEYLNSQNSKNEKELRKKFVKFNEDFDKKFNLKNDFRVIAPELKDL